MVQGILLLTLLQIVVNRHWLLRSIRSTTLLSVGAFLLAMPDSARCDDNILDAIPNADTSWVGTWAGSPSGTNNPNFASSAYNATNAFSNQTIRLIVHASLGGSRVRIRLSNEISDAPINIGSAHIALTSMGAGIIAGSDRTLTFNGGSLTVTIPPNAVMLSDFVKLDVPALADLSVSLYLPDTVTVTTAVPTSLQTNYVAPMGSGDTTGFATLSPDTVDPTITQWPLLTRVDVHSPGSRVFVAFGSSITLGYLTTPNANARWTDVLAKRLRNHGLPVSVVNSSIVANALSRNGAGLGALARLDRDVFSQPDVGYLFINDILGVESQIATSPDEVIAGLRQIIERAHDHNIKIYAGTVLPLGGANGYSATFEANRQGVNAFIRTGGELDGIVDFDAALRDPSNPTVILSAYDGGDHHHPNDLGNKIMAQLFDLALFQ